MQYTQVIYSLHPLKASASKLDIWSLSCLDLLSASVTTHQSHMGLRRSYIDWHDQHHREGGNWEEKPIIHKVLKF